jgi:uncharacterized protein (TIRG00374 family)
MKKHILLPLKILVSVILITYLFSFIPFSEILLSLKSSDNRLVLTGIVLTAFMVFLSALETQYLTNIQGITLNVFEIIKIHLSTSFYALFLPGTLSGGAVKWFKFSQHGSKLSAAAVVIFNRFLEVFAIIIIGMCFFLITIETSDNPLLIIAWFMMFLFMVIFYYILMNKHALDYVGKNIPSLFLPTYISNKIGIFITTMQQFQNLNRKENCEIFGLLFLYHLIGVVAFFCFAKSLNIDVNIWVIGWVRSAIYILVMLPFSFAGFGIREGILVFLLNKYGVLPSDSMALSFIFFFSQNLLFSLVGGLFDFKSFIEKKY